MAGRLMARRRPVSWRNASGKPDSAALLHGAALARGAGALFPPTVGLQERARMVGTHRLAEGEALRVFAAELIELDRVGIGFRALSHHFHAEVVSERHDRAQDH